MHFCNHAITVVATYVSERFGVGQDFSRSFNGIKPTSGGLNCGITKSTVHDSLNPQFAWNWRIVPPQFQYEVVEEIGSEHYDVFTIVNRQLHNIGSIIIIKTR